MVEVKRQSVVPLGVVVARGFAEYGVGLRRSLKGGKENRDEQQIFKTTGFHIIYFLAVISVCIYLLISKFALFIKTHMNGSKKMIITELYCF